MELISQATQQQQQQYPAGHTNLRSTATTMAARGSPSLPQDLEIPGAHIPRHRFTPIDNEALRLDDEVHPERQAQARASASPRVGLNLRRRSSSPLSFCVATPLPSDEHQPQHQLLCYSRRGSTSRDGAGSTANVVAAPGAASTSLLSNLSDGGSTSLFLQEGRQQQQQKQQTTFDGLICEAAKRIGEDDEDGDGCMSPGGNTISQARSDESEFQSPTAVSAAARLGAHLVPHHLLQPQPTTTTTTATTCSTGTSFVVSVPTTSPPCQRRDEELDEILLANQKQPTTPKNARTRAAPDASIDCGRGSSRPPTSVTPTPEATTTTTTIASAAVSVSPQQHLSTFAVRTASSSIVQRGRSGEVDVPPGSRGHTSATPLSRSTSMCQFGGSYSDLPSFTISGGVGDASIAERSQQPRHSYDGGRPSSSTPSHHHHPQPCSSIHPLARSCLLSPGATPLSPSAPSFFMCHSASSTAYSYLQQQAAGGPRHSVAATATATVPLVNHSRDDPSTPTGGSPVRPTAATTTTTAASGGTPSLQHHQLPPPPPSNGRLSQNNTPCGPTHPNSSTRKARHHSHQPTVSWTSDEIASSTGATSVPSPVVIIHPQQQPPATTATVIATRLQQEPSSSSLLFPLSSLADRRRGNSSDSTTPHRLATLRLPGTVSNIMHEELEVGGDHLLAAAAVGGGGGGAEVRTPPTTMHHHHHHHDGHSRSNSSSGRTTTTPSAHTAAELILSPSVQACKTTKEQQQQHPLSEQQHQHQLSTSCSSSVTSPHVRYYNASFSSPKIYQLPAATAAASATSGPLRGLSSAVHQPHHHQMGSSFSFSQNHSIANAALGRSVGSTSSSLPQPPPTPMLRSPLDRCGMSYQPHPTQQSHAAFDLSTSSSSSSPTMIVRVPASWHSWLNQEGQPQGQGLPPGGETTPALRYSEPHMNERDSIATMRMMQMTQQTATQRWEVEKVECVSRWEVVSQQFGRSLRLQQRQQEQQQQQQRRILFRRERGAGGLPEDEPKDCRRRVDAGLALIWKLLSRLMAFLLRRCRRYLRMLE